MDLDIQQVSCEDIPYKGSLQRTELAVRGQFTESTQKLLQSFFGLLFPGEKEVSVKRQIPDFLEGILTSCHHVSERTCFQVDGARLLAEEDLSTFGPNGKECNGR